MKGLFLGISICTALSYCFADAPTTLWTKTFGGADNDAGYFVQQTVDGGYIATGSTGSYGAGGSDVWLVKTDASGNTLWSKTFGDSGSDMGYEVRQTFDKGYIITGNADINNTGDSDIWLIKTDSLGDTLWTRSWGNLSHWDCGFSVQQTSDSGYILTGCWNDSIVYDLFLIKTDASGDTLWTRIYGDSLHNWGESVKETFDNCYIITGYTTIGSEGHIWLLKIDSSGDTLWTKTLNKTPWSKGRAVQQTLDSGYIVVGYTMPAPEDICLIKTDSNGDTSWTKIFGGDSSDISYSVQQTLDSGYVIIGYTKSYGAGNYDGWLIKTDASGDTLWTKTYGGIAYDRANSVQETEDGGYIITGWTGSSGAGGNDLWLIKTSAAGVEESEARFKIQDSRLKIGENPVVQGTLISYSLPHQGVISLKIQDISGREIETLVSGEKNAGNHVFEWNARGLASGIYFVQLQAQDYKETKKFILVK